MKELLCCIGVALLAQSASGQQWCPGDLNWDGKVTIDEIIISVNSDLNGCSVTRERFIDNDNGTITDGQTGLLWEKETFTTKEERYSWAGTCSISGAYCQPDAAASAACLAGVEGDTTGCAQCSGDAGTCTHPTFTTVWQRVVTLNGENFGGHSDWRVPRKQELLGIIDDTVATPPVVNIAFSGAMCGVDCTDITSAACSCTAPDVYDSATTLATAPSKAWAVSFSDGSTDGPQDPGNKTFTAHMRAVRGGL